MPYKRGQKWEAQVKINGKKKRKLFMTKKEAAKWEWDMKRKLDQDIVDIENPTVEKGMIIHPEEPLNQKMTMVCLGKWANEYLNYSKAVFTKKTYKEKCAVFRFFFKSIDPALPTNMLESGDILSHLLKQKEERSGNAANKDRKNLIAAWNWGMKYMIPPLQGPNPFLVKKMPEVRHPRYIPSEEDFWKVYDVAEGQDRVMILTFLYLAARRGEIFRLTWEDVDFGNSQIRIWTRKRQDGSFECDWLPMTKELRDALRWWWENRPIKDTEYVFVCLNEHPGQAQNYGKPFVTHPKLMKRLCDKAKVKYFSFHAIRHLTSTILYKLGYRVKDIQPILRHKSPRTTELYLGKLGLNEMETILESLTCKSKREPVILQFKNGAHKGAHKRAHK